VDTAEVRETGEVMNAIKKTVRGMLLWVYESAQPYLSERPVDTTFPSLVKSYSCHGEDLVVDAILRYKQTGIYVDIGANDPIHTSNTKRFYDRGWSGICIEPNPQKWAVFCQVRPRDITLNCGVSDTEGAFTFYCMDQDNVSTFDPAVVKHMGIERGAKVVQECSVTTKRLENIIGEYPGSNREIDFMSVDVEGYELKVLRSNNWELYRPKLLVVEMNKNTQIIETYLCSKGYALVFQNNENQIFTSTEFFT
jgi:FkbM family methyltransferase